VFVHPPELSYSRISQVLLCTDILMRVYKSCYINPQNLPFIIGTIAFRFPQSYILSTDCIHAFCMDLWKSSNFCPLQLYWSAFITEKSVYCAVRTGSFKQNRLRLVLKGWNKQLVDTLFLKFWPEYYFEFHSWGYIHCTAVSWIAVGPASYRTALFIVLKRELRNKQ
jgi:hypothetical protein